jgi:hypothetical protein
MCQAGPITIDVRVEVPGNSPITASTQGAKLVLLIWNSSSVDQDIEYECAIANGRLLFDPPVVWPQETLCVPPLTLSQPGYRVEFAIKRSSAPNGGTETLKVNWIRYRDNGVSSYGKYHSQTKKHTATVTTK